MLTWIDALEFENYGGFVPETQFVQEMGQAYLMSIDKPGIPVESASTHFKAKKSDYYRIWIRTKNWLKTHSPGRLQLWVDDVPLGGEVSTLPSEKWYWELAGEISLDAGEHKVTVEDTTGYFSRFSSIIITSDVNFVPAHDHERMISQRATIKGISQDIIDNGNWDLIVVGAGPSGIPAAISAARKGLKVALINSRPGLGGNASDEGTVGLDGAAVHHNMHREGGIAEEIRRHRDHYGDGWESAMRRLVESEENISVFYNQFLLNAITEHNTILSVLSYNGITCQYYRFSATYYADCTGDGWLGYYAGASYRLGRESKRQYNEPFAPEQPDTATMSGCLMGSVNGKQILGYYAEDTGSPQAFTAPDWAVKLPEGDALYRSPNRLHTGEWWIENATNWDDLWDQEAVRDELLRLNLGYFHWLKNSYSRRKLAQNLKITAFGRYNARRENRRLIGDYVLTQNDLESGARFKDAISYCGWPLDVHHDKGIYSGSEGPFYSNTKVKITHIPYRSIYSENIDNLFMAGRCVSVSHLALGSVRVESTLATLGQAVGTAAYLCKKHNVTNRDLGENHLSELQYCLLKDDQYIPDLLMNDKHDLVHQSKICASSVSTKELFPTQRGVLGKWQYLDQTWTAAIPCEHKTTTYSLLLKNDNSDLQTMNVMIGVMNNKQSFEEMEIVSKLPIRIQGQYEGYVDVEIDTSKIPSDAVKLAFILPATQSIAWMERNFCSDGRIKGYPLDSYFWFSDTSNTLEVQEKGRVEISANTDISQITNGWNRPLSPDIYMWVSSDKDRSPWIEIKWDETQVINELHLVFDSDFTNPAMSYLPRKFVNTLVRNYRIDAWVNNSWVEVSNNKNNFLRKNIIHFSSLETESIKIHFDETWGCPSARVVEVKAY